MQYLGNIVYFKSVARGMLKNGLSPELVDKLLTCSSIEEAKTQCTGTSFESGVSKVFTLEVPHSCEGPLFNLEKGLRCQVADDFRMFYTTASRSLRKSLDLVRCTIEIKNLVNIIRGIHHCIDESLIRVSCIPIAHKTMAHPDDLLSLGDITEIIDGVRDLQIRRAIKASMKDFDQSTSIWHFELAMDRMLLTLVKQGTKRASDEIDMYNILTLLRLKALKENPMSWFYKTSNATYARVVSLVDALSVEEALQGLTEVYPFGSAIQKVLSSSPVSLGLLEQEMHKIIITRRMRMLRTSYNGYEAVLAFFELRDYQIQDLLKIFTGIYLESRPEEIKELLIFN